jgi:DNA polymerase-1
MKVTHHNFNSVLADIASNQKIALDTETTGLSPYEGARLFALIVATPKQSYYFNFHSEHPDYLGDEAFKPIGEAINKTARIYMANAKFDMHFLSREGIEVTPRVVDVLILAKMLNNSHLSYSLAEVAKREGFQKLDIVDKYIKEHKLYEMKGDKKTPRFDRVPHHIMEQYAENDAIITMKLGLKLGDRANKLCKDYPSFEEILKLEFETTKACFEIERRGMRIDEDAIKQAIAFEESNIEKAEVDFISETGEAFVDSNKHLSGVFSRLGINGGKTEKGNPSFTESVLSKIDHPVASIILRQRKATKRCNTYFKNFLSMSNEGIVHPNIRQAGADTFRFSVTNPALQTLNAEEDGPYKVRDSFRARDGFYLCAIDYQAQEYRLAVDYANEKKQIEVIKSGGDVHQATADLVGITRKNAKVLNFALLYGASYVKISHMIGVSESEGKAMVEKYFAKLPSLSSFLKQTVQEAKRKGFVTNWAGRILKFPKSEFAYKAPNYLIQSSGADIMRSALVQLTNHLRDYKSKIVMTIHDEILFEIHRTETHLIPEIREIMVKVYPPKHGLEMDTSVEIGLSWGSLGELDGKEEGDTLSREGGEVSKELTGDGSFFDTASGDSGDAGPSYLL